MKTNNNTIDIYKARTIGSLFLLAFLAYGLGRHFFENGNYTEKYLGGLLIIINSIMVFFIGILFKKTLQQYNPVVGNFYLFTRVFESLALASILLSLIPSASISNDHGYFLAMLVLGLGSIPMCLTLLKHTISPAWLALWGVIGYAIFSFGFLMELFGRVWSMYLLIPGGLWEITFAIWLIRNGGTGRKTRTTNNK